MTMEALDSKYCEGLVKSAKEVFETMIFMTPTDIKELGEEDYSQTIRDEVIGILGFTGTKSGVVSLHGSKNLGAAICASMLGMEIDEVEGDQDIADSFGELVNMITGSFKNLWVEDGNAMDLSIPSVVFGEGVSLSTAKSSHIGYACRMYFDAGTLEINLRFND